MPRPIKPTNTEARLALALAAVLLAGAAALWWVPSTQSSLRVTAVNVEAWRGWLLERAQLSGDEAARAEAAESLAAFRAEALAGRSRRVSGAEWAGLFRELSASTGRWRTDLPPKWRDRVSAEDESHVTAVFFHKDEPPFAALSLAEGERVFLELDPAGPLLLEVFHVQPFRREGPVTTSRFYKSRWTVPEALAYPMRRLASIFAGGAAALALLAFVLRLAAPGATARRGEGARPRNLRRRSAWTAVATTAVLAALCFVPGLSGMDMMNGGFALIFVAGTGAIAAFVVAIMFFRSAKRLDRLLADPQAIFWKYPPEEWLRFVDAEVGVDQAEKRRLFWMVAMIMGIVGGGFLLVIQDAAAIAVVLVLAAVLGIIALIVLFGPGVRRRRLLRGPFEAWVGRSGILLASTFHDLEMMGGALEDVGLGEAQGVRMLQVTWSYVSRYGRQTATVRAPLPGNDEAEGRRACAVLLAGKEATLPGGHVSGGLT